MNRRRLIRLFILNEIADDYEDLPKITNEVIALGAKCGVKISSTEILQEVIKSIEAGLAKAYRLSATLPAEEIRGVPSEGEIEGCYFWVTRLGSSELQSADDSTWPFDNKGALKKSWSLTIGE